MTRDQLIADVIRLQILGHGQGLTCLYVMLHTKPAYSALISLVSAHDNYLGFIWT